MEKSNKQIYLKSDEGYIKIDKSVTVTGDPVYITYNRISKGTKK